MRKDFSISKNTYPSLITSKGLCLVVEQPGALLDERNTQFLRGLEDRTVVLASAGRGNVFGAGAGGAEDVVDEGELREST